MHLLAVLRTSGLLALSSLFASSPTHAQDFIGSPFYDFELIVTEGDFVTGAAGSRDL
ncbi:MAG: hypothetical protein ACFBZ8_03280 [Opitutales bacterium]